MSGKLFLTATPIGNLEDITLRALRVMREADIIAAEDTRRTRKLLTHFNIATPMTSYYEQNKIQKAPYLLSLLQQDKSIVLVSDAGTPGISDPGSDLVQKAIEVGAEIIPVPGPAAFVAALIASGLNTEKFVFVGFLPRKAKELMSELDKLANEEKTLIFYEAPHRVLHTLKALREAFPHRNLVSARELTKVHEEFIRGTTEQVYQHFEVKPPKGEFCLILEGAKIVVPENTEECIEEAEKYFRSELLLGNTKKEAVKKTAQKFGLSKNMLYQKLIAEDKTNIEN